MSERFNLAPTRFESCLGRTGVRCGSCWALCGILGDRWGGVRILESVKFSVMLAQIVYRSGVTLVVSALAPLALGLWNQTVRVEASAADRIYSPLVISVIRVLSGGIL